MVGLAKIIKPFFKEKKGNGLLNKMAFAGYESGNRWLSKNLENVDQYEADELCGFLFTTNGFINLFQLMVKAFDKKDWKVTNSELPILMIAGQEDPVIQGKDKFEQLKQFLVSVGYKNVSSKLYPTLKHEILNEKENQMIYEDVYAFNPSPISKELFTLPLSYVDWWFCNEIEGAILFGKNQKQKMADQIAMDPEKIMQQFQKQYPQSHLILTLGKKGSYYCDKKDILFQPAFEVKAIDTTAAGDTYSGYFLADLAGGKNISDALKDASLAASICVTRKGAAPSIPYKKEIENLELNKK